jgi:hypothetical protein
MYGIETHFSEPIYTTERTIIPEGTGVGEGHHIYKIDGMYYLISTDYSPNGRTLCSRSKSIWGPYETITITADETMGYHPAPITQWKGRIVDDGSQFVIPQPDIHATGWQCPSGRHRVNPRRQWWALLISRLPQSRPHGRPASRDMERRWR